MFWAEVGVNQMWYDTFVLRLQHVSSIINKEVVFMVQPPVTEVKAFQHWTIRATIRPVSLMLRNSSKNPDLRNLHPEKNALDKIALEWRNQTNECINETELHLKMILGKDALPKLFSPARRLNLLMKTRRNHFNGT